MQKNDPQSNRANSFGTATEKSALSNSIVVSLILPGVKPELLGHALRDACPRISFHWANEDFFSDQGQVETHSADQTIAFWAIVHRSGGHIIHGKEVMGFWRTFSNAAWITMLGNPLWRAIDSYRNITQDKNHALHEEVVSKKLSVGKFFASPISMVVRNRQSSKLAGVSRSHSLDPGELYREAAKRLDHFAWIGLEGIDHGPQPRLARALQKEELQIAMPIIQQQRGRKNGVDAQTERVIREANRADFKLWEKFHQRRKFDFLRR